MQPRTLVLAAVAIPAFLAPLACAQPFQTFTPPPASGPAIPSPAAKPPAPLPESFPLTFDASTVDAGQHLSSERSITHKFTFVNRSDRVFKPQVSVGCGRTAVLDKHRLEPGESGELFLTLPISELDGRFERTATIFDAENRSLAHVVRLAVDVVPVLRIETVGSLEIADGAGATIQCIITGLGSDFALTGVKSVTEFLKADIGAPESTTVRGRAARRIPVTVRVDPAMPCGSRWQKIVLTTDKSDLPTVTHNFNLEVISPIIVSQSRLVLAPSCHGLLGNVQLSARDSLPFAPSLIEVIPTKGSPPIVNWSYQMVDGQLGISIAATLETDVPAASLKGTLVVHTNDLARPIRIPYTGYRESKVSVGCVAQK